MTAASPTFRQSSASAEEIAAHLRRCDEDFVPRLSGRLDIAAYADKVAGNAVTFEAWSHGRLVGLVAAYLNDRARRAGFVTNVSVEAPFMGRGIGATLFGACLARARTDGFARLTLEVDADNRRAIRFYEKFGFVVQNAGQNAGQKTGQESGDDTLTMSLGLDPSRPEARTGGTR
ncbi:MAG: GNAT family N-acetyltransferase [Inquilinaceae bacterium]